LSDLAVAEAHPRRSPTPGAPEKQAVRAMFDRIAPRYDLLNRLLSAGIDARWRRRAVDELDLRGPARLLDLCSGTADLLLEALRRDAEMRGVGADLSEGMLRRGHEKLVRGGLGGRASLVAADGESLPFAADSFGGALVAFGIRNIGDRERALRELHRVLRPGGRLVVLEFSMPPGVLGMAYRFYFRHVLPRVGAWISGDPEAYTYLPASVAVFPDPPAFGSLLEGAGFTAVRWTPLTSGIAHLHRGEKRGGA
jgi:demethylmenaquinone methyltransferase / 2-methoxy-6-polyprenyl-1,4-benzoquinol methylase